MKIVSVVVVCSGLLAVTGCATSRGPTRLTPDVREQVKSVSVSHEILTPERISLPSGAAIMFGAVGGLAQAMRQSSFNDQMRSGCDSQGLIQTMLRNSFLTQVEKKGLFQLVDHSGTTNADAEFVLEIYKLGLTPGELFSSKLAPVIGVRVLLIRNPPVELLRSKWGLLEPLDPENHPIVYHKDVEIWGYPGSGLPSHDEGDYRSQAVFTSAFGKAIEKAVQEVVEDW